MCSIIDSGEKGYKLPEQILFNVLPLFPTLVKQTLINVYGENTCNLQCSAEAAIPREYRGNFSKVAAETPWLRILSRPNFHKIVNLN